MMTFKEDRPIYLQIASRICEEILTEGYPENERLPSIREYAALVEVNANTVVRSYDYLQAQQIIYNKRGIGYFVSEGAKKMIFAQRKTEFIQKELCVVFQQMDLLGMSLADIEREYRHYLQHKKTY